MIKRFINLVKLYLIKKRWRKNNKHNYTTLMNSVDSEIIKVGVGTYGPINISSWNSKDEKLVIGNYCSIANNVLFILGGEHSYKGLTTYPFKAKLENKIEAFSKGPIIISDFVWIGTNVTILSGVNIGEGSIIGAGSVVSKDVLDYSIVAGNPAKLIKMRFENDIIEILKKMDIFYIVESQILSIDELYDDLTLDKVLKIKKIYDKEVNSG